jgi:hypothetical protein
MESKEKENSTTGKNVTIWLNLSKNQCDNNKILTSFMFSVETEECTEEEREVNLS